MRLNEAICFIKAPKENVVLMRCFTGHQSSTPAAHPQHSLNRAKRKTRHIQQPQSVPLRYIDQSGGDSRHPLRLTHPLCTQRTGYVRFAGGGGGGVLTLSACPVHANTDHESHQCRGNRYAKFSLAKLRFTRMPPAFSHHTWGGVWLGFENRGRPLRATR